MLGFETPPKNQGEWGKIGDLIHLWVLWVRDIERQIGSLLSICYTQLASIHAQWISTLWDSRYLKGITYLYLFMVGKCDMWYYSLSIDPLNYFLDGIPRVATITAPYHGPSRRGQMVG